MSVSPQGLGNTCAGVFAPLRGPRLVACITAFTLRLKDLGPLAHRGEEQSSQEVLLHPGHRGCLGPSWGERPYCWKGPAHLRAGRWAGRAGGWWSRPEHEPRTAGGGGPRSPPPASSRQHVKGLQPHSARQGAATARGMLSFCTRGGFSALGSSLTETTVFA